MVFNRVTARVEFGAIASFPDAKVSVSNQACRTSGAREVREVAMAFEHQGPVQIQLAQTPERAQLFDAQPDGDMPVAQGNNFVEVRIMP
jgi:hypothetical protein